MGSWVTEESGQINEGIQQYFEVFIGLWSSYIAYKAFARKRKDCMPLGVIVFHKFGYGSTLCSRSIFFLIIWFFNRARRWTATAGGWRTSFFWFAFVFFYLSELQLFYFFFFTLEDDEDEDELDDLDLLLRFLYYIKYTFLFLPLDNHFSWIKTYLPMTFSATKTTFISRLRSFRFFRLSCNLHFYSLFIDNFTIHLINSFLNRFFGVINLNGANFTMKQ